MIVPDVMRHGGHSRRRTKKRVRGKLPRLPVTEDYHIVSRIILLGPQRQKPTVEAALGALGVEGQVCSVTAGWQEREGEIEELEDHVCCPVTDLMLYHRAEAVFEQDPEFFKAHRARQDRLRELQRLYRLRLSHALEAARQLQAAESEEAGLLGEARRAALASVRSLDRYHLRQLRRIHAEFRSVWQPSERPAIAAQRAQLAEQLSASGALLIAGGHVGILISRLRLFDLDALFKDLPIVAWSAGAMALSEKIVLFHDHPPQGQSDPEILDLGLGRVRNLVPLPHARRRLDLDDGFRIALFAARFAPDLCATLEAGSLLHWHDDALYKVQACYGLTRQGRVDEVAIL